MASIATICHWRLCVPTDPPIRMRISRRQLLATGASFAAAAFGREGVEPASPAEIGENAGKDLSQPSPAIALWPDGAPGMPALPPVESITERSLDPLLPDRVVQGITHPRLLVFRPAHPTGAAVLLFPGGGYHHVVVDREGYEMGRWLAARGFTAFVLFYRLPGEGWAAGANVALSDAHPSPGNR